jgi:hypothetical protein
MCLPTRQDSNPISLTMAKCPIPAIPLRPRHPSRSRLDLNFNINQCRRMESTECLNIAHIRACPLNIPNRINIMYSSRRLVLTHPSRITITSRPECNTRILHHRHMVPCNLIWASHLHRLVLCFLRFRYHPKTHLEFTILLQCINSTPPCQPLQAIGNNLRSEAMSRRRILVDPVCHLCIR